MKMKLEAVSLGYFWTNRNFCNFFSKLSKHGDLGPCAIKGSDSEKIVNIYQ